MQKLEDAYCSIALCKREVRGLGGGVGEQIIGFLSKRCLDIIESQPSASYSEILCVTRLIKEDGFVEFDLARELIYLLHGKSFYPQDKYICEFNPLHGLGHYDDLIPWIKVNKIELYPIGSWSTYALYVGDDEQLYISDPENILVSVLDGGLSVIEYLIMGAADIRVTMVPPVINYD